MAGRSAVCRAGPAGDGTGRPRLLSCGRQPRQPDHRLRRPAGAAAPARHAAAAVRCSLQRRDRAFRGGWAQLRRRLGAGRGAGAGGPDPACARSGRTGHGQSRAAGNRRAVRAAAGAGGLRRASGVPPTGAGGARAVAWWPR
ncbi:hypothetical protein G6F50_016323 [Rhizopus delemar]|uniref:Uncharacterized protein n=1 Tax=Rhizopus delemar TaxID=936053 RepID=A0A9P7C1Z9_9FUNG|nr:hypothetical protein G6F50_016323 [Rhizopus delemar]